MSIDSQDRDPSGFKKITSLAGDINTGLIKVEMRLHYFKRWVSDIDEVVRFVGIAKRGDKGLTPSQVSYLYYKLTAYLDYHQMKFGDITNDIDHVARQVKSLASMMYNYEAAVEYDYEDDDDENVDDEFVNFPTDPKSL